MSEFNIKLLICLAATHLMPSIKNSQQDVAITVILLHQTWPAGVKETKLEIKIMIIEENLKTAYSLCLFKNNPKNILLKDH